MRSPLNRQHPAVGCGVTSAVLGITVILIIRRTLVRYVRLMTRARCLSLCDVDAFHADGETFPLYFAPFNSCINIARGSMWLYKLNGRWVRMTKHPAGLGGSCLSRPTAGWVHSDCARYSGRSSKFCLLKVLSHDPGNIHSRLLTVIDIGQAVSERS